MTTRRKFMTILGGGVILAATGGGIWAATRDPVGARVPWTTAGAGEADPRRFALSYAILAPNPHNRQPWVADLGTPGEVILTVDPERRLPQTDPFDRQITIGLGCFLELLVQAAAETGHRADVELFPAGEPQPRLDDRPVARIRFIPDAGVARDPLFAAVLDRRSNKEPYDTARPVAPDALAGIAAVATVSRIAHTAAPDEVAALRERAWAAMELEMTTPATALESIELIRVGRAEIERSPDGIDLSGPMFEALDGFGLMTREAMTDPTSMAFQGQMSAMKVPFDTAMAFLWQTTAGNNRADQIAAGRDWVRMNLSATAVGLSIHPFSQALQEFPEMALHHAGMRQALGVAEGETLQMFARLGYGPTPKPSPRWPYQTRIRPA